MSFKQVSLWAPLPRTARGSPCVMGCNPQGTRLLYGAANSVVIRSVEDMADCEMYTQHSVPVTVAKWSPSGYYICSADTHGKIRIWDTVNREHLLKAEYQPLSGVVRDVVWSPDSTRLAVVGEGRGRFCAVLMVDTGASVKADMSGHSKTVNTVDWRSERPFRLATGGEDCKVALYEGPPFTFMCSKTDHQKYVQVVRFSGDGKYLASGGFDGRVFLYDGASGALVRELGGPAHTGGVYGLSWGAGGRLVTASGDKKVKVWDVVDGCLVSEHVMGTDVPCQQMSCLWLPGTETQVSLSLSGELNVIRGGEVTTTRGHQAPITRVAASLDGTWLYTCGIDGTVIRWGCDGKGERVQGRGHGNQVSGLAVLDSAVYTCGIDDRLATICPKTLRYTGADLALPSQPQHLCVMGRGVLVACLKELVVVVDGAVESCMEVDYPPLCVGVGQGGLVAVGGGDNKLRVYRATGAQLELVHTHTHLGAVTGVTFSLCGRYLAACDAYRKVMVYTTSAPFPRAVTADWVFHNAKINCVAFSPSGSLLATGSLDTNVIVWNLNDVHKRITINQSHPQAQVTGLVWLSETRLVTVGHDAAVRAWDVGSDV